MAVVHLLKRPNLVGAILGAYALLFTYTALSQLTHAKRLEDLRHLMTIGLLDAESGQRAYLLTGDRAFLKQYRSGLRALAIYEPVYMNSLIDPESLNLSKQLDELLRLKLAEMGSTIAIYRQVSPAQASAIVMNKTGHTYTEKIYEKLEQIQKIESRHIAPTELWESSPREIDIHNGDQASLRSAFLSLTRSLGF